MCLKEYFVKVLSLNVMNTFVLVHTTRYLLTLCWIMISLWFIPGNSKHSINWKNQRLSLSIIFEMQRNWQYLYYVLFIWNLREKILSFWHWFISETCRFQHFLSCWVNFTKITRNANLQNKMETNFTKSVQSSY